MTPVAMGTQAPPADVLGHVDEVDYHTVRSTAALARLSCVSAPSTSATRPGAQPAPSRRSSPGGVPAEAAASARHRRPPRPNRRPPPGCVDRGVLAGACASTPGPVGAAPVRARSHSSAGLRAMRGRLWHQSSPPDRMPPSGSSSSSRRGSRTQRNAGGVRAGGGAGFGGGRCRRRAPSTSAPSWPTLSRPCTR